MIYRQMPDKTLDTYLHVKLTYRTKWREALASVLWPRSPQEDWMNFSRIALNMFLSGLNNYVNGRG